MLTDPKNRVNGASPSVDTTDVSTVTLDLGVTQVGGKGPTEMETARLPQSVGADSGRIVRRYTLAKMCLRGSGDARGRDPAPVS